MNTEKIREVLSEIGYQLQDRGSEWRSRAVYRDGDNPTALKIDKATGKWSDFVTGDYGDIFKLIKLSNPNVDIEKFKAGNQDVELEERVRKSADKLDYQTVYSKDLLNRLVKDYSYWEKRGIRKEVLEEFGGGLSSAKMAGRFIFPIFNIDSNIVGFSGRIIYDNLNDGVIKWKHLGNKTNWDYPLFKSLPHIDESGYVIVVESIGDMLSLWNSGIKNVLVSFGVTGLTKLMYKIASLGKYVSISLNDDSSNNGAGNKAAVFFARQLLSTGLIDREKIKILKPFKKDFGEMAPEENIRWKAWAESKIKFN